eukprot:UN09175
MYRNFLFQSMPSSKKKLQLLEGSEPSALACRGVIESLHLSSAHQLVT